MENVLLFVLRSFMKRLKVRVIRNARRMTECDRNGTDIEHRSFSFITLRRLIELFTP